MPASATQLRRRLLAWYDRHRRELPWRAPPTVAVEPYRVWVSEIMLQQTTVVAVIPYFATFIARWPTVGDLAAAELDEVLHAWQGLGYYARARNLHACARTVADTLHGRFPERVEDLRRLPGIGAYTAAAIAAIAFDQPAVPVDGNVLRVLSRLHAVAAPPRQARPRIESLAAALVADHRPGDFAQAMMDLGATVCTPRTPRCDACPWMSGCAGLAAGRPEAFPKAARKRPKPTRRGVAFWVERGDGSVLLRQRPARGLLGGLMEVPTTEWRERPWMEAEAAAAAPLPADWRPLAEAVRHPFTHFDLELCVWVGHSDDDGAVAGVWWPTDRLDAQALPSVMRKVARHALSRADDASARRKPGS
ncbi:MAG: A/G-specific adenine glycosylase [Rhodospirillales bacterium]